MKKIIINTDIGGDFDDFLAVTMALGSPEVEIVGIVTTKYNIREKAIMMRKLLLLAGKASIPVFYSGCIGEKKDNYISVFDYDFLSQEDLDKDDNYWNISPDGVEFLIESIKADPCNITVISIAPNMNIAEAFRRAPETPSLIQGIHFMCGCFDKESEHYKYPEHNLRRGYTAFKEIAALSHEGRMKIVTKDLCWDLFLPPSELRQKETGPFGKAFLYLMEKNLSFFDKDAFRLSDPITIGSCLWENIYEGVEVEPKFRKQKMNCEHSPDSGIFAYTDFNRNEFLNCMIELIRKTISGN